MIDTYAFTCEEKVDRHISQFTMGLNKSFTYLEVQKFKKYKS